MSRPGWSGTGSFVRTRVWIAPVPVLQLPSPPTHRTIASSVSSSTSLR